VDRDGDSDGSADPRAESHPESRPVAHDDVAGSMQAKVEQAADLLRSIGSTHRLMILCLLSERDRTVTEVCEAMGLRQSLASQHLGRLRLDGLVKAERKGHFVHYSLSNPIARDIVAVLHRHFCADAATPQGSSNDL
jgi:ArsR family transcriptional regulator, virulence genes transcriptional regulator